MAIAKSSGWLFLCVFLYRQLRGEIAQNPETFVFLKRLCVLDQEEPFWILCSLVQRMPKVEALLKVFSQTGFVQTYLSATLQSTNPACVEFGMLFFDLSARVGYADEWVAALNVFIDFLSNKFETYGSDVIKVITTLSPFPPCMAVMRGAR
jgi:hypothetical protein